MESKYKKHHAKWVQISTYALLVVMMMGCCASTQNNNGHGSVDGEVLKHMWEVDYVLWSPDCVEKVVIGINGEFPGPSIRGHVGDTLEVHVHNLLPTETLSIHWHGIRQVDFHIC